MNATPAHTPTPWKDSGYLEIEGPGGLVIANTGPTDSMPLAEQLANTKLIVRAVNSHEALLDALVFVASRTNDENQFLLDAPMHQAKQEWDQAMKLIRAAIAKAEGTK